MTLVVVATGFGVALLAYSLLILFFSEERRVRVQLDTLSPLRVIASGGGRAHSQPIQIARGHAGGSLGPKGAARDRPLLPISICYPAGC